MLVEAETVAVSPGAKRCGRRCAAAWPAAGPGDGARTPRRQGGTPPSRGITWRGDRESCTSGQSRYSDLELARYLGPERGWRSTPVTTLYVVPAHVGSHIRHTMFTTRPDDAVVGVQRLREAGLLME